MQAGPAGDEPGLLAGAPPPPTPTLSLHERIDALRSERLSRLLRVQLPIVIAGVACMLIGVATTATAEHGDGGFFALHIGPFLLLLALMPSILFALRIFIALFVIAAWFLFAALVMNASTTLQTATSGEWRRNAAAVTLALAIIIGLLALRLCHLFLILSYTVGQARSVLTSTWRVMGGIQLSLGVHYCVDVAALVAQQRVGLRHAGTYRKGCESGQLACEAELIILYTCLAVLAIALGSLSLWEPLQRVTHNFLAHRGNRVTAAAGIAELFNNKSAEEVIAYARLTFRSIRLDNLRKEHFIQRRPIIVPPVRKYRSSLRSYGRLRVLSSEATISALVANDEQQGCGQMERIVSIASSTSVGSLVHVAAKPKRMSSMSGLRGLQAAPQGGQGSVMPAHLLGRLPASASSPPVASGYSHHGEHRSFGECASGRGPLGEGCCDISRLESAVSLATSDESGGLCADGGPLSASRGAAAMHAKNTSCGKAFGRQSSAAVMSGPRSAHSTPMAAHRHERPAREYPLPMRAPTSTQTTPAIARRMLYRDRTQPMTVTGGSSRTQDVFGLAGAAAGGAEAEWREEAQEALRMRQELYSLSEAATLGSVDVFISHSWQDDPEEKWAALQAWRASFVQAHKREPLGWFDQACIHPSTIEDQLGGLPVYLAGCKTLLALVGPSYWTRLWCVIEMLVHFEMGAGHARVQMIQFGFKDDERLSESDIDISKASATDPGDEERLRAVIENSGEGTDALNLWVRRLVRNNSTAAALDAEHQRWGRDSRLGSMFKGGLSKSTSTARRSASTFFSSPAYPDRMRRLSNFRSHMVSKSSVSRQSDPRPSEPHASSSPGGGSRGRTPSPPGSV